MHEAHVGYGEPNLARLDASFTVWPAWHGTSSTAGLGSAGTPELAVSASQARAMQETARGCRWLHAQGHMEDTALFPDAAMRDTQVHTLILFGY